MNKISLLDQDTINKIAAGEVVERPLSIVKELVENSMDAMATSITVEIEDGGIKLIRITDNGIGIEKDQIREAFLRHATSKIQKASDLMHIESLGFRGEALASISAVSRTECISKTVDSLTGVRYVMEGGIEKSYEEIGVPNGTSFIIRDLFYNVPARKKFLKSEQTEAGYISDLISRMALSHPGISFKYIVNGKVRLHTSGNYSLQDCIYQIFGKEFAKHSKEVNYQEGTVRIYGFIGDAILARGNRQYEIYYVNGRYIKSNHIQKGIEEGTKENMMINQFPFAVLFIELPHEQVDVNVHPNKMQVRFSDEDAMTELMKTAIVNTLHQAEPIRSVELSEEKEVKQEASLEKKHHMEWIQKAPEPFETKRNLQYQESISRETVAFHENTPMVREEATVIRETAPIMPKIIEKEEPYKGVNESFEVFLDKEKVKKHQIIGQAFNTYWIVQYHQELYIIDQHAAHEKVLYEKWMQAIGDTSISAQMLLEPLVLDFSDREYEIYKRHKEDLEKLGFLLEEFGQNTILVKSVPYLLNQTGSTMDFVLLFDQLNESSLLKKEDHYAQELASIACKAAIKGNDKLSVREYQQLIEDLLLLEDPYYCPHKRPTMIRLSQYELEKKFKRKV